MGRKPDFNENQLIFREDKFGIAIFALIPSLMANNHIFEFKTKLLHLVFL